MKYTLAVLAVTASMQSSANSWLCISDQATGFALKEGNWKEVSFKSGDKYLIEEADEVTNSVYGAVYQVNYFDADIPHWICGEFGSNEDAKELLVCDGLATVGDTFKYNPRTGKFLATRTYGHVHDYEGTVSPDSPYIEIGTCLKR